MIHFLPEKKVEQCFCVLKHISSCSSLNDYFRDSPLAPLIPSVGAAILLLNMRKKRRRREGGGFFGPPAKNNARDLHLAEGISPKP